MPEGASFGIKRPAFTRGHGGGAGPHIQLHPLQTREVFLLKRASFGVKGFAFARVCGRNPGAENVHFRRNKAYWYGRRGCFFGIVIAVLRGERPLWFLLQ